MEGRNTKNLGERNKTAEARKDNTEMRKTRDPLIQMMEENTYTELARIMVQRMERGEIVGAKFLLFILAEKEKRQKGAIDTPRTAQATPEAEAMRHDAEEMLQIYLKLPQAARERIRYMTEGAALVEESARAAV